MAGEDQAPSDTPCKWCGKPNQECDYEEYAAPCMSGQISRGELVRVAADGGAQQMIENVRNYSLRAQRLYHDPAYPPRKCDRDGCGATYTGPSLYCSLACALFDA